MDPVGFFAGSPLLLACWWYWHSSPMSLPAWFSFIIFLMHASSHRLACAGCMWRKWHTLCICIPYHLLQIHYYLVRSLLFVSSFARHCDRCTLGVPPSHHESWLLFFAGSPYFLCAFALRHVLGFGVSIHSCEAERQACHALHDRQHLRCCSYLRRLVDIVDSPAPCLLPISSVALSITSSQCAYNPWHVFVKFMGSLRRLLRCATWFRAIVYDVDIHIRVCLLSSVRLDVRTVSIPRLFFKMVPDVSSVVGSTVPGPPACRIKSRSSSAPGCPPHVVEF